MGRLQSINAFHSSLIRAEKDSAVICGWSSRQSQAARFAALLRVARFSGGTVVDYGCGTGDLYEYLRGTGFDFEYVGYDQSSQMLGIARAKHGPLFRQVALDEVSFSPADYVFASGIFQFVDEDKPDYHKELTRRLFAASRKAAAANFLSSLRSPASKFAGEMYLRPEELVSMAQPLTKLWTLDHSYHPGSGDMTLGLLNDAAAGLWLRPAREATCS